MSPRKGGLDAFLPDPGPQIALVPDPGDRQKNRRRAARQPRPRKAAQPAAPGTARERVQAARRSAYDAPKTWQDYSVRLPRALARSLAVRVADDRDETGDSGLALCHYVEAALGSVPGLRPVRHPDGSTILLPVAAAAIGIAWREANRSSSGEVIVTGTRLRKGTADRLGQITGRLRLLDDRVRAWEICAGAVAALLGELNGAAGSDTGQG
jgi:hypothetical protein